MKRIIALFTCIMMIVGIFPQVSFAATTSRLPKNSIIAGDTIFTDIYMTLNENEVNTQIRNNPGRVFYINSSGDIKDEYNNVVTEQQIVEKNIRILTLKSTTNDNGTKYVADENGIFVDIPNNSTFKRYGYIILNVQFIEYDVKKAIDVTIKEINHVPEAYYYIVSPTDISNESNLNNLESYRLNKRLLNERFTLANTNVSTLYIVFYNSAGRKVATGTIKNISGNLSNYPLLLYVEQQYSESYLENIKGNISNNGIVATDGEFLYYSNSADGGKIYKKSIDGYEDYPICNDNAKYINVVGDFIYYSNISDGGKIYRIKTDGTSRSRINNVLSSYINVINNDIYYVNGKRGNKIYKLSVHNTDSQYEGSLITTDKAAYLVLTSSGDKIYYSNLSDKGRLYSIDTKTLTRMGYATSTGKINIGVRYISLTKNDEVYCTGYDAKLYRLNLANNKLEVIDIQTTLIGKGKNATPRIVTDKVGFINAVDSNTIYFKSIADGGKIYKVDMTGAAVKVVDDTATAVNIIGDYIFYLKGVKLYIYDMGLDNKPIAATKFKPEDKIIKIDDLEQLPYGSPLPDVVSAIMDDGSVKDVLVTWDTKNVKGKNGVYTYKGTVIGYGTKVQVSSVKYSQPVSINNIEVYNEEGAKADRIVVRGLQQGDEITIYREDDKILGKVKADKKGDATLSNIDLAPEGGNIKVTRTSLGNAPSIYVVKLYEGEAPSILKVEYIAQNDSYGITFKGLQENITEGIKYGVNKPNTNVDISKFINVDKANISEKGANIYYFEIPKNQTDKDGNYLYIDKLENQYIRIAYQKANNTSKPYTMLAQLEPNVYYDFTQGAFIGLNGSMEFRMQGSNQWVNAIELIQEQYKITGKAFIEIRFKPSSNKMPGKSKYVSLVPMPNVAITSQEQEIFNSQNTNTYNFDVSTSTLVAKYIANTSSSGIAIKITPIDNFSSSRLKYSYQLKSIDSTETVTYSADDLDSIKNLSNLLDLKENNILTINLYESTAPNKIIATQNISFKIFNKTIPNPVPQMAGVVGKYENGKYICYSAKVVVPAAQSMGSTIPVIGTISYNNGKEIPYSFEYVSDSNGGRWEGMTINSTNYGAGEYEVKVKYENALFKPSTITAQEGIIKFEINNKIAPQISIKNDNGSIGKIVRAYSPVGGLNESYNNLLVAYTGEVELKGFKTEDTSIEPNKVEWLDNKNSVRDINNKDYSFYVEYSMNDGATWTSVKRDDKLTIKGTYLLRVTVYNNKNGHYAYYEYSFRIE